MSKSHHETNIVTPLFTGVFSSSHLYPLSFFSICSSFSSGYEARFCPGLEKVKFSSISSLLTARDSVSDRKSLAVILDS